HRAPNHAVALGQLKTLTELAGLAGVSVRVVPYQAYQGLDAGPFTILDFPDDQRYGHLLTTVHAVHSGQPCLLTTRNAIDRYQQWWDDTRAIALDESASLRLIAELWR